MRSREYKIIKYIIMSFSLVMAIFLFGGAKVSAESTDLYFESKALASGYDSNGKAIIIDELNVYAYNNGAGRQIDPSHTLRLYSVTVKIGEESKTFDIPDDTSHTYVGEITNGHSYKNFDSKRVDKIPLKISAMLSEFKNDSYNNDVYISLRFQQRSKIAWWYGSWTDYSTPVIYYGGKTAYSDNVLYNITNSVTLDTGLNNAITAKITNSSNCRETSKECYYNMEDLNNNSPLNVTITSAFPLNGELRLSIKVTGAYVPIMTINFNNSTTGTINLVEKGLQVDETLTYTIDGVYVRKLSDKYGTASATNFVALAQELKVVVDQTPPNIESAGIKQPLNANNQPITSIYDIADIPVSFKTSESKDYTLTIETLYFKVGTNNVSVVCNCSPNQVGGNSDTLTTTVQLSGNGLVTLIGLTGVLEDEHGNIREYTIDSNNVTSGVNFTNSEVTLISSIDSITSNKDYYYSGETVILQIAMKSTQVYEKVSLSIVRADGTATTKDYTFSSSVNNISYVVSNEAAGTYISSIDLYRQNTETKEYVKVYTKDLKIYLNTYFDLVLSPEGKTVDNKTVITNPVNNTVVLHDEAVEDFKAYYSSSTDMTCEKNAQGIALCRYDSEAEDGSVVLKIEQGNMVLANGFRNNEKVFTVVINKKVPVIESIYVSSNVILSQEKYYYKNYTDAITVNIKDGNYDGEICLHYTFDESVALTNYTKLCSDTLTIDLPSVVGEYTLRYYVSDGINQSDVKVYDNKFVYRNSFELGDIEIKVNDIDVKNLNNENISTEYFNYIQLKYINAEHLFARFDLKLKVAQEISGFNTLSSNTFNITKSQLGSISDVVTLSITLTDKIGNKYQKDLLISIDTINPSFDDITVENYNSNGVYTVKINGYGDNDVKVKLDGVETDVNDNYTFTTELTKYTIVLIDRAGNRSEKVFTTEVPKLIFKNFGNGVYDVKYDLYIDPFDSSIHVIEDYRYLVFEYTEDEISESDIYVARNNICTADRTIKCYKIGNYSASSDTIMQTFARGYTYIIQIKINNVLVNQSGTNLLPRLNLTHPDINKPTSGYLDEDINPDYISSTSGEKFSFKFLASDPNLTSTFHYLVVDKSQVPSVSISTFYNLYKTCYGATIDTNGCGVYGELEYEEEVETDIYLGNVVLEANHNTKRRLKNNEQYSLYVLLSDESGNVELFHVRNFTNITNSSNIEYENDNNDYVSISNGQSVSTNNSSTIRISKYNNIDIKSVIVNGTAVECKNDNLYCTYTLATGRYDVEVEDVLGNISNVVVYSGTASNPVIEVYYKYNDEEYFKIIDNSFAYNTSNTSKVYVKVKGNGIHTVKVAMSKETSYVSGTVLYESLTDVDNTYGVSLLDIMNAHNESEYSGTVNISANNGSGETLITLIVDNEVPQITVVPMDSKLDLLGDTPSVLHYDPDTKYSISFDYQREVTYAYLMNVLSLKVDGISFNEIIENNRFKLRIDGNVFTSYDDSITKGVRKITIDYFDNAGNEAETFIINVTCQDSQKPTISLSQVLSTVEANTVVTLAQVLMSDNHDSNEDLELKVTIEGTEIDYTSYKFVLPGEYTIVYTVKDTSNQISTINQSVIVKDTIAPELKDGTQTRYEIGIGAELEFALPSFVDSDANSTSYKPYQILVYTPTGEIMDDSKANYPLLVDSDVIKVRFVNEFNIGIYVIKFMVKDDWGNVKEELFEIVVKDSNVPELEVSVNGINVENNGSISLPLGSEVNVSYFASDEYDGDITNSVSVLVTYDGRVVNGINSTLPGDYIVSFSVKDSSDNITSYTITVKIKDDEVAPVINEVKVNNVTVLEGTTGKINGDSLKVEVDASDDSNGAFVEIIVNNSYSLENGELIAIEQGVYGVVYNLKVIVKDTSNNQTVKEYNVILDNKLPSISGVENGEIYLNKAEMNITDENIDVIEIYINNILSSTFNVNLGSYEVSTNGLYRVVAKDTYGNVSSKSFLVLSEKKFNIMGGDNNAKLYDYDFASLVEVTLEDNKVVFHLQENNSISAYDNVYILVKYPNSNYKYVAYQMNGETYLVNNTVSIGSSIIEGYEPSQLLEKVGDKYYAYVMVVKDNNEGNTATPKDKDDGIIKGIVTAVLAVVGIIAVLILFIKLRRKVRAV